MFQQDSAPAHNARKTDALLSAEMLDFIGPHYRSTGHQTAWISIRLTTQSGHFARASVSLPDP